MNPITAIPVVFLLCTSAGLMAIEEDKSLVGTVIRIEDAKEIVPVLFLKDVRGDDLNVFVGFGVLKTKEKVCCWPVGGDPESQRLLKDFAEDRKGELHATVASELISRSADNTKIYFVKVSKEKPVPKKVGP